jgi:hypothetical protein
MRAWWLPSVILVALTFTVLFQAGANPLAMRVIAAVSLPVWCRRSSASSLGVRKPMGPESEVEAKRQSPAFRVPTSSFRPAKVLLDRSSPGDPHGFYPSQVPAS